MVDLVRVLAAVAARAVLVGLVDEDLDAAARTRRLFATLFLQHKQPQNTSSVSIMQCTHDVIMQCQATAVMQH